MGMFAARLPLVGCCTGNSTIQPTAVYDGGLGGKDIRLRIGNGGAGQSGLIGAWANAFIQYCNKQSVEPFLVGWYLGDTTQSLSYLATGEIDVAVTYNEAAEMQACKTGSAVERVYGFRDHFWLVGPPSDPGKLNSAGGDVVAMFNQIVAQGNADVATPPTDRVPVRFLSRFDKSATNIKESLLFTQIGQASALSEYTLTDKGTWLSSPEDVTSALSVFAQGGDINPNDPLLNPAHVILGAKADPANKEIWEKFIEWVKLPNGGQQVISDFKQPPGPSGVVLYSQAPNVTLQC
ncbi:hypothetical protein EV363DRAFT_1429857 [Boletus edulis]|nr:hypothetical protein EV363DRAFT_1429857 [Boletus edulis]